MSCRRLRAGRHLQKGRRLAIRTVVCSALWLGCVLCLLTACSPSDEAALDSSDVVTSSAERAAMSKRAAVYRQQAAAAETELVAWQGWFHDLARGENMDRCPASWLRDDAPQNVPPEPDGVEGHELCLRHQSQSLLWDPKVTAALADDDIEATDCCGVLRTIVQFQRQLQSVDVDLLVVVVPSASAVYPERIGFATPLGPGETPPLLDGRLRVFYAALEEAGVEVLDLLPAYLAQRDKGEPFEGAQGVQRELLYFRQDPHWTSFGAAVAAQEMAQRVRRYPWFEELVAHMGQAQLEETFPVTVQLGSIVRRLRDRGETRRNLRPELRRRRQVRIRGELWSQNDVASPIILMGDSFSADTYDLPGQLLKELGFRVDTVTVTGGLPTGGLKALRFRGDGLQGKKLVIWEITSYALVRQESWQPVDVLSTGTAPADSP